MTREKYLFPPEEQVLKDKQDREPFCSAALRDVLRRGRGPLPISGLTAQEKPADLFTIDPASIGRAGKRPITAITLPPSDC